MARDFVTEPSPSAEPLRVSSADAASVSSRGPRWIDQTILHGEATAGNCMQAAVASLFGLSLADVPHFAADGDRCHLGLMNFAECHGFDLVYEGKATSRDGLYLACGQTERGTHHMVVYRDGALWHDPHPSRAGLAKLDFVYFLVPHDPAMHVAACSAAKVLTPLLKNASSGPWEADSLDSECGWGPYKSAHLMDAAGKTVLDALNSDVGCLADESDDDGRWTVDTQATADCAYVEALDNVARNLIAIATPAPKIEARRAEMRSSSVEDESLVGESRGAHE